MSVPGCPPLRCVVIVPDLDPGTAEPGWRVLFANGSEAEARKAAAEWLLSNPDSEAHLCIRDDTARAVTRIEWSKP